MRRARAASRPRLRLYTRAGCHLCEDMAAGLEELFGHDRFELERIDIDADPALVARYGRDVPVLVDGEHEICRHFLDPLAVTERLSGYNDRSGRG